MVKRCCIICRARWDAYMFDHMYCICDCCISYITGGGYRYCIYIQNDYDYIGIFNQFDYFRAGLCLKWKGFYCKVHNNYGHNDKWIIPEWIKEKETTDHITKILTEKKTDDEKFIVLYEFLLERGVDITQNIQIKQYGKSARSII